MLVAVIDSMHHDSVNVVIDRKSRAPLDLPGLITLGSSHDNKVNLRGRVVLHLGCISPLARWFKPMMIRGCYHVEGITGSEKECISSADGRFITI